MNRSSLGRILQVFQSRGHRQNPSSDGFGQVRPSGHDSGQVRVIEFCPGSAFGSAWGTRAAARCRRLSQNRVVVMRRNSRAIKGFRRVLSRSVVCRRMFRKNGGGGNCTRGPVCVTFCPKYGYGTTLSAFPEGGREAEE